METPFDREVVPIYLENINIISDIYKKIQSLN